MMKHQLTGQTGDDLDVNVDALLAAINEISESEVHRTLDDPQRASVEVKQLARTHAAELGEKIRELQAMQRTLETLARRCHGDGRPTCPILDDLAS